MKILFVAWGLAKASGVTTFVERTSDKLRELGSVVDVIDTQMKPEIVSLKNYDILHLHCLWKLHAYSIMAKKTGIPVVYSTHGMTAPWSMHHKWWKKVPAWWLYQKQDLMNAEIIHCTTEQELVWNRKHGFNNCIVVPLGTDERPADNINFRTVKNERILLFVGRIYPVKGLVNLIKAWKILREKYIIFLNVPWKLRIVGPNEAGHQAELEALVADLGVQDSVEFPGPKFGEELSEEYESCDCLVLPSFTENFGATVIDALAHGKPCITSTFTPWKVLKDRNCGWWVSNEPSVLANTIYEMADAGVYKRWEMGVHGLALVREKYTWGAVTNKMLDAYQSIINNS